MATDVIMYVGEQFYTLAEYIDEANTQGVHKRIPLNSIPEGMVAGESRIFLAHKKAIVKPKLIASLLSIAYYLNKYGCMSYEDYQDFTQSWNVSLVELYLSSVQPESHVPQGMLTLAVAFSRAGADIQRMLTEKYEIEFLPGIFGFAYIANLHYILAEGEEELPPELAHMDDLIKPVHVKIVE